jgi:hypothetical protein
MAKRKKPRPTMVRLDAELYERVETLARADRRHYCAVAKISRIEIVMQVVVSGRRSTQILSSAGQGRGRTRPRSVALLRCSAGI